MPEPGQSSDDELAALYLRARDVPCPACGANRRDGDTAACPDCTHKLSVKPAPHRPLELRPIYCYLLTGMLLAFTAVFTASTLMNLLASNEHGEPTRRDSWMIQAIIINVAWLAGSIVAVRAILAVRQRRAGAGRTVGLAIGLFLVGLGVLVFPMIVFLR